MLIRTVTAAPGDQPASISERAKVPEVPNVAADSTRQAESGPGACCSASSSVAITSVTMVSSVKVRYADDTSGRG